VDVLLRSVACARKMGAPVRLAIVGDGDLRPRLERLAGELGVSGHVHFAGYRANMMAVAPAGDIAVLSSDNEGTPVSLIEAAAAGVPAVATAVGGVPDVVRPETGVLVRARDPEKLGHAVASLAADAERRASMGQQARAHVAARFTVERLVQDIGHLYEELIDESRAILERAGRLTDTQLLSPP
jgi:glycosyltransferase involved in cell wall biosynthesis